jgi:hypothetical protein
MTSKRIYWHNFIIIAFTILVLTNCYTKSKIDLNNLHDKYEISGNWYRGGGYTNTYKGVISAFKVDYILSIYEDGTYKYQCNDLKFGGTFEVQGDTVIFIGSNNRKYLYFYNLDGHDLTFIKLDSVKVPTCMPDKKDDAFAGTWKYK